MYKKIILDNEEWNYYIYDDGRVFSLYNNRFLSPDISTGYARVLLCKNKRHKRINVHTLVGLHFIPNPNNLPIVHHKDNNILNNCVDNLEWISYADNVKPVNCIKHEKLANIEYNIEELLNEEWRVFKDGRYIVSNLGRLKNTDSNKLLFGHVNPVTTYIRDNLCFRDGTKQTLPRHHIVWEAFHPEEKIKILNHKDGNKINNRLINLENINISENLNHAYRILCNKSTRKCCGKNLLTGEIKIFFCIKDAADFCKCEESTIRGALNRELQNKQHNSHGYSWYNLTDEEYSQVLKSSETIESIIRKKYPNE